MKKHLFRMHELREGLRGARSCVRGRGACSTRSPRASEELAASSSSARRTTSSPVSASVRTICFASRCDASRASCTAPPMSWAGPRSWTTSKRRSRRTAWCACTPSTRRGRRTRRSRTCAENPERQIVESTRKLGLCTKNQTNALVALLNKRNECAHPSAFYPGLNEALGYISELIQRLTTLMPKTL